MNEPLPKPDIARATRGRFLPRHGARVIEQDDLLIVEFVAGEPWYTAPTVKPLKAWANGFWAYLLTLIVTGATTAQHQLHK